MRILILGGAGFLGQRLLQTLLEHEEFTVAGATNQKISEIIVFDMMPSPIESSDARVSVVIGDISDKETLHLLFAKKIDIIYHLAAVVSGQAEQDFNLGMQVNLHASLQILEICRNLEYAPMLIFASSCAVFGGVLPDVITDHTAATPQSSYGTEKAVVELLINDYSRRGFVDGRVLRLPTIVVRPGKPNAATSSFASSIIRAPLNGLKAICPVSRDTRIWILSPHKVMTHFIHAARITKDQLTDNCIISLPGLTTSVDEMVGSLESLADRKTIELIKFEPDPFIQSIVMTWPHTFDTKKALHLGFESEASIDDVIRSYIDNM